jgi:hypothetical protein
MQEKLDCPIADPPAPRDDEKQGHFSRHKKAPGEAGAFE